MIKTINLNFKNGSKHENNYFIAKTPFGEYSTLPFINEKGIAHTVNVVLYFNGEIIKIEVKNTEAAFKFAQNHFEERIKKCIDYIDPYVYR